eukprot:5458636-Pleurochrysis_carterae.AAC.1
MDDRLPVRAWRRLRPDIEPPPALPHYPAVPPCWRRGAAQALVASLVYAGTIRKPHVFPILRKSLSRIIRTVAAPRQEGEEREKGRERKGVRESERETMQRVGEGEKEERL